MEIKIIEKSVQINAPAQAVWDVITKESNNSIWLAEFGEGNVALTDWQEGSRAQFVDGSGNGLAAIIESGKPYSEIVIAYDGQVVDGKDDLISDDAKSLKGYGEKYLFRENGDVTTMTIAIDVHESGYEEMAAYWENALHKIKLLAEA